MFEDYTWRLLELWLESNRHVKKKTFYSQQWYLFGSYVLHSKGTNIFNHKIHQVHINNMVDVTV